MEHGGSIVSLMIVIVAAFLTPLLLHRFKLNIIPVVVAEILVGLIIGQSGFDIVHSGAWLDTLSTLGFIFLMFLSGLEIDFTAFSRKKKNSSGPNAMVVSSVIFAFILLLSLALSYGFVFAGFIDNPFLMTIIISTISLGVVVPTLKEQKLIKTNIGQIILLIAVIADLATMILLALFVSFYEGGGNTWLLLVLFLALVLLYFIGSKFKHGKYTEALSKGTVQIGTRAVFMVIIFFVALSETVGAENILGAFLAGVLVSLLKPNQELVHQLDSFGYGFLIPIFFVMIGVNLNIWGLFSDPKLLALIPLLLIALFISKVIPVLLLKKWYDNRTFLASSILLTSTLSLVIAASTIGERMGMITSEMSGTFILVAIISSIFTPILFKKLMPKQNIQEKKITVALVGTNQLTLSVYNDIKSSLYVPTLYHRKLGPSEGKPSDSHFNVVELESYEEESLERGGVFENDIVVFSTSDEIVNSKLAILAKRKKVERVIARIESPDLQREVRESGIEVFSMLTAQNVLLRASIESPSMIELLTNQETALYEIKIKNPKYEGIMVRKFPFTGDIIFVRIFRGIDSIIPHGETELQLNDRLIVTGSKEYVDELKRELEIND